MRYLFFILLILSKMTMADSLNVEVNPKEPVVNEAFDVSFEISLESNDDVDPVINFEPIGLEVISKSNPAVSTKTMFINGKMSFERKVSVKYSMVAPTSGYAFLRKINVEYGDKKLRFRNINIRVLQTARKPQDIFLEAEISKEKFYAGESILVRYYLYNAQEYPLNATDVLRFPKLSKFLKRYHQEKSIPERVNYKGRVYVRRVIYTAQLFAPKEGKYNIDPLSLNVTYSDRRGGGIDRFGFGLSFGQMKKRSIQSKQITLNIVPVPLEGMPQDFTGLVGKHEFILKNNKQKFLANEPIELELTVKGEGALELFEAPKLLVDDMIEEFETNSDLKINENFTADKKFEYTYLGRGDLKIPQKNLSFSYFDPEEEKFKTANIDFGPFEVVGFGQAAPKNTERVETQEKQSGESVREVVVAPTNYFKPLYKSINSFIYYSKHLFLVMGGLLVIFLTYLAVEQFKAYRNRDKSLFERIYSDGLTYSRFYRVIQKLGDKPAMVENINDSKLSEKTKNYLLELTEVINAKYKGENSNKKFEIKKKYFQEVEGYLKKKSDDNDNQS